MPNPLTQLIHDRFIRPQVESQLAVAKSNLPVAVGTSMVPEVSLDKAIGQPHDTNYALYKLNTDVSGCVHKWAGGITGPGWRITTMSPDTKLTDALKTQMTDIERWIKNPNPSKLFSLMLYELVQHLAIVGTDSGTSPRTSRADRWRSGRFTRPWWGSSPPAMARFWVTSCVCRGITR